MYKSDYPRAPYQRPFDSLLKDKKDLIGTEIGVYRGQHAKEMLLLLDIKKFYLIDTWKNYTEYYHEVKLKNQLGEAYQDAKEILKEFDDGRLIWVKAFSADAVKQFQDNSLDFVYIDANHTYPYVKQDIQLWLPKVKIGGLIGGHDYTNKPDRYKYGVKTAIDEFCKNNKIKLWTQWCPKYPNGDQTKDWGFIRK